MTEYSIALRLRDNHGRLITRVTTDFGDNKREAIRFATEDAQNEGLEVISASAVAVSEQ